MELSDTSLDQTTNTTWSGSDASLQANGEKRNEDMTFQSKDPIIPIISMDKKKVDQMGGDDGHGMGFKQTTYLDTLMHLFRGNVGSGIYAMGDGFKNAGLVLGPPAIIVLGIICVHCQHVLLSASRKVAELTGSERRPNFAETVELCFETGPKTMKKLAPHMKKLVNLFLCITQLGFCCVYFVFVATNLEKVCTYYGWEVDIHFHMAMILVPILLSCFIRNLKYLAPVSMFANIVMFVGIIITIYYTTQDVPELSTRRYVADWQQWPLFFGTALYSFEGIGLVLPLQNEMKKPEYFTKPLGVLNLGMSVVTLLFITMGFTSYLKYGDEITGSVTINLPEGEILAQSVKMIISLAILLSYALQYYIPFAIMWPQVVELLGPFKRPLLMEYIFRTCLVLLTFTLAEVIPYLNLFISLVGAVSSTALALLFPPIIQMALASNVSEINIWMIVKNTIILVIGVLGCVTGTYESIRSIYNEFNK